MNLINIAYAGVISDAPSVSKVGVNVLNFLLSIFGLIGIIMLVVYGIIYLTSYGDSKTMERAKAGSMYAAVGVIIALSALVVMHTIGQFF